MLQMPVRFVCLTLGDGDVERRRGQASSRRSKGGQPGTAWESGLKRR